MDSAAITPLLPLKNLGDNAQIAGVDEAGRGALAGPVVAAAVILDPKFDISLLKDSKRLSETKRNQIAQQLMDSNSDIGIGIVTEKKIDDLNILNATLSAMKKAILKLKTKPSLSIIDGNHCPTIKNYTIKYQIKADQTIKSVSAASIIAKVTRDSIMTQFHTDPKFTKYNFIEHKGYGTQSHYDALFKYGSSDIHRQSFNLSQQGQLF